MTNPHINRFIGRLEDLREEENRAALATLRRALSGSAEHSLGTFRYIGHWLPQYAADQDNYILIAALFASHPKPGGTGNMGDHMARLSLVDENKAKSAERRFMTLLTAHPEDLAYHLRQAVSLLNSQEVPINWTQLLHDVQNWDDEDRFVQRKWATAFWSHAPEKPTHSST
jgi:CRISPR system Cascade subunit CasB